MKKQSGKKRQFDLREEKFVRRGVDHFQFRARAHANCALIRHQQEGKYFRGKGQTNDKCREKEPDGNQQARS